MKTLKKLFSVSAIVALLGTLAPMYAFGAGTSLDLNPEFPAAYAYAYSNGITTQTEANVNMGGSLTRIALAKMIANYAINVLGMTPDTSAKCTFTDVTAALDAQYDNWVTLACQLGLMGQNITAFRPNDLVNRWEFGTTLSRALNHDSDDLASMNAADPYYKEHLNFLKSEGIMTKIDNPSQTEVRGYVMLMMMRADETTPSTDGCSAEELLACITADDYDACIAECAGEEPEEPADPEEVKAGTLNVTMKSEEGGELPNGGSSVSVVTYTLKATDEDININALVLEQKGYSQSAMDAALFIDGARVSKVKPLKIDDKVTLNLASSYTVKAGKSVDIEVRVSTPYDAISQQFAVELNSVDSSAEKVKLPSNAKSNTFKLIGTKTAQVTISNGSISTSDPKAGENGVDLFSIKVAWDTTQDVELNSITLYSNDKNIADYIENMELMVNDTVVAEWTLNGRYLTFVLDNAQKIEKNKNVTFTVKADVIGWAGEGAQGFKFEEAIDAQVTALTYNAPANVLWKGATFTAFTVEAGKVTITRDNPGTTTFTKDKKNVYLGSFTITNNEKGDLTLDEFYLWVDDEDVDTLFNNNPAYIGELKVRYGSTSAAFNELKRDATEGAYKAEDSQSIGKKLTVYVYADIKGAVTTANSFKVKLLKDSDVSATTGLLKIVDSDNNKVSSISFPTAWAIMKWAYSTMNISRVALSSPKTYGEGAENVEAVSFKIKAGTTEGIKVSSLTFDSYDNTAVAEKWTITVAESTPATNTITVDWHTIPYNTNLATTAGDLYTALNADTQLPYTVTNANPLVVTAKIPWKALSITTWATSVANLSAIYAQTTASAAWVALDTNTVLSAELDVDWKAYPAKVNSNGTITVNKSFTVEAGKTATITLKLNLASNPKVKNFTYVLSNVEAEDTAEDPATLDTKPYIEWRNVVIWNGSLTISMENVENNKYAKSILAWTDAVVAEYNIKANNSKVELIDGTITLAVANTKLADRVTDVELYYWDKKIADDATIDTANIVFEHVNATFDTEKTPLTVKLLTKAFNGNEDVAETALKITKLTLTAAYDEAWNDATPGAYTATIQREFDIVPVLVTTSVKSQSSTKTVLTLDVNKWDNTRDDNDEIDVSLKQAKDAFAFTVAANNWWLSSMIIKNWNTVLFNTNIQTKGNCDAADVDLKVSPDVAWAKTLCLHKQSTTADDYKINAWTEYTISYMVWDAPSPSYTVDLEDVVFSVTNKAWTPVTFSFGSRLQEALQLVDRN